jgi:DNA-binding transcriptional ArsR family regulator
VHGFGDLHGQLPGRDEHQAADCTLATITGKPLQHRERERRGLARSGRCLSEDIAALEQQRNRFTLDGSRLFVAERRDRGHELTVEMESGEPGGRIGASHPSIMAPCGTGLTFILVITKLLKMSLAPAVFQAIASPRRQEILRLVWDRELSAGNIARAMPDVTFGAVSLQLRALADAGLVESRAVHRHRFYRARPEMLGPLAEALERMWDDALWRLKLAAELEQTRRGPLRKQRRRTHPSKRRQTS